MSEPKELQEAKAWAKKFNGYSMVLLAALEAKEAELKATMALADNWKHFYENALAGEKTEKSRADKAEAELASLGDTINQELRGNGPADVGQYYRTEDFKNGVRYLVDLVRKRSEARADGLAKELEALHETLSNYHMKRCPAFKEGEAALNGAKGSLVACRQREDKLIAALQALKAGPEDEKVREALDFADDSHNIDDPATILAAWGRSLQADIKASEIKKVLMADVIEAAETEPGSGEYAPDFLRLCAQSLDYSTGGGPMIDRLKMYADNLEAKRQAWIMSKERDEAKGPFSEQLVDSENRIAELNKALAQATKERDEARAETGRERQEAILKNGLLQQAESRIGYLNGEIVEQDKALAAEREKSKRVQAIIKRMDCDCAGEWDREGSAPRCYRCLALSESETSEEKP